MIFENAAPNTKKFGATVAFFALLALALSTSGGCSKLLSREGTDAAKATVVAIVGDYLTAVALSQERPLHSLILWDEFLRDGQRLMTRGEVSAQLMSLKNRWTPADHPLLGLEVLSVSVQGNDAKVELRKKGHPDYPVIWVKMIWSGTGWLIVEDSLFGRGKLIEQLNASQKS